jgi:Protein of unknown function (DUF3489)
MTEQTTTRRPRKMAREANLEAPNDVVLEGEDGEEAKPVRSTVPKQPSKVSQVLDLLRRLEGATLAQLVEATGWQPHTTRATLTGLRKKGHAITKEKVDGVTRYTIVAAASE